jgi:hypothetical protein
MVQVSVGNRWLQFVPVLGDPFLEVERSAYHGDKVNAFKGRFIGL